MVSAEAAPGVPLGAAGRPKHKIAHAAVPSPGDDDATAAAAAE